MEKQTDRKRCTQGFSLVELSIVLVIIGLLIGGMLSLRGYVANAKLNTMMNETKFYISAFHQFQTRYNNPPGDYATASLAWTGAGNGNGDGMINLASEHFYVFQHLALSGFIPGKYTGAANAYGGATRGLNVPNSAIDTVTYYFDHPTAADGFVVADGLYPDGQYGNTLVVAGIAGNAATGPNLGFLIPQDMLKIDTKYDDGLPLTGDLVISKFTPTCYSSSAYNIGLKNPVCWFFDKMQ